MKKVSLLVVSVFLLLISCRETKKDYATLSGKIDHPTAKEITISSRSGYTKKIKITEDGTFKDTLHLKDKGELFLFSGGINSRLFLKNNDNIKVSFDVKEPVKSLKFSGEGAGTNNYIAQKMKMQKEVNIQELFGLDKASFEKKSNEIVTKFKSLVDNAKDVDTAFLSDEKKGVADLSEMLKQQYNQVNAENNKYKKLEGNPSPEFTNYENYKGGTTSLKDLKGKYVYIDVWATWCRPCVGEIPHLKKLEEKFKGKNIQFVSISVDRETAKEAWRKMIKTKEMGGIQLFATKGDSFAKEYQINSIPRFILLDPQGNVVKANAPRPSSPSINSLLTSLLK